jgi:hypothetical protein
MTTYLLTTLDPSLLAEDSDQADATIIKKGAALCSAL